MRVFRSFGEASSICNPVVTTGSFDGVHIGHKTILNRLKMLSEKYNGESVLITFDPHPRKVLYPETTGKNLKLINSQEEKLFLLNKAGLDNLVIIKFTKEFARTTSEQFVRDYLHGALNARVVVVGFNHHFGFNQEGDYRRLWEVRTKYNFEPEEIPEQEVENETVSSTKIREAIRDGYIQKANAYLDHYYIIMGKPAPFHYENIYCPLSLANIPVIDENKLLPADGIYAVSFESGERYLKGMVIINSAGNEGPQVLLYLLNNELYPIGYDSTVYFHKKVHGALDIYDYKYSAPRLKSSIDEITELIY